MFYQIKERFKTKIINLNNLQKSTDLVLRNFRLNLASLKLNVIQAKPNRSATISSKLSSHVNSTTGKPSTIVLNKKSKKKQVKKLTFQDEIISTSVSSNENDEKKRAENVGFLCRVFVYLFNNWNFLLISKLNWEVVAFDNN